MPKPQTANPALQAYSRQQSAGRLCPTRYRAGHSAEAPAARIGVLLEMARKWVASYAPGIGAEQLHREAMALVGDFLSLSPRGPGPHHSYRERFRDYLDGAAAPAEDLEN